MRARAGAAFSMVAAAVSAHRLVACARLRCLVPLLSCPCLVPRCQPVSFLHLLRDFPRPDAFHSRRTAPRRSRHRGLRRLADRRSQHARAQFVPLPCPAWRFLYRDGRSSACSALLEQQRQLSSCCCSDAWRCQSVLFSGQIHGPASFSLQSPSPAVLPRSPRATSTVFSPPQRFAPPSRLHGAQRLHTAAP